MDDALARFHRTLVEEILRSRPLYLSEPFTVSEIYQNLVPYRTHRDRLGIEMNGDYEDVLLRLLAGEGEYLVLESEHARREIEHELASPSPNTGLYREYAAVDVRLNPLRMPRDLPDPVLTTARAEFAASLPSADEGPEVPPDLPDLPLPSYAPAAEPTPAVRPVAPPFVPPPAPPAPPAATATPAARPALTRCLWCSEPLPRRDTLNYCPFCGADVHKAPCRNCGDEVEEGWRFCVACGTSVEGLT